jgi:hypothetical protein
MHAMVCRAAGNGSQLLPSQDQRGVALELNCPCQSPSRQRAHLLVQTAAQAHSSRRLCTPSAVRLPIATNALRERCASARTEIVWLHSFHANSGTPSEPQSFATRHSVNLALYLSLSTSLLTYFAPSRASANAQQRPQPPSFHEFSSRSSGYAKRGPHQPLVPRYRCARTRKVTESQVLVLGGRRETFPLPWCLRY